ncbi:MAG: MBL fold metallo-hydrolase, partial [Cryomorphaceae bacterium]
MDRLTVTFLGSGTSMGVPVIGCSCPVCKSDDDRDKRLRSSILVQKGGRNVIVDSGPDFRYQVLRTHIDHLTGLVFTHEHKDHTAGLDDVRAFNFIQKKAVEIYASEAVEKALRNDFHYAFAGDKYPGVPEVKV